MSQPINVPTGVTPTLQQLIRESIQKQMDSVIEEESRLATERAGKRIRDIAAQAAVRILDKVTFHQLERELRIVVDIETHQA